ncbi:hypothetical protein PHYSODRAFT_257518 [Phytophthora sojae]|uniref:Uncharacterized protein n=1 Tax=Phytophthora sojae (strain P6497) TaxID=1094619 RepID=G4YGN0_PHYSP|nr:hypothetical protein PHYSODRAFT_257518 [Phytophthora sojae]EGZ26993.1 hypothetical protein PHYSODRAFT_257518 [Phytophthora sojae]|eukprot:XP_009514268.1 hypothetical protein PHYSODRAFT_257518 [Phytophthora sojae]
MADASDSARYAKAPHLWALGVGAVVSGDFFGWQSGLVAAAHHPGARHANPHFLATNLGMIRLEILQAVGRKLKTGKGATFKATVYTRFDATRDDSVDLLPFEVPPLEPPQKMSPMPGGALRCHWGRSSYSAVLSLWPLHVILAVLPLEPFSMRHVHHPCDDVVHGQAGPLKT